jgi:exodeoxyribonuclease VII large subunit
MQNHLTLSQLQKLVKATLDEAFALPVWVSAEIAEIKINYSGHCYLELVEKGGDNGVPLSQARAVIWRTAYARIAGYFEAETGQRLAAGIRILARVMISYHELYGFSLNILDIDPTFTLGDMERQRQITIERLQREGVWDINRENPLPQVVQRIAIVSSRQAAGYQDFCKELGKSPYAFSLTLFDAFMQGAGAEDSIVAALDAVADRMDDFDAVVLIRGGGVGQRPELFIIHTEYPVVIHETAGSTPVKEILSVGNPKDSILSLSVVLHRILYKGGSG